MGLNTIAILSPGDMGHGVGKVLVDGGYRVTTLLDKYELVWLCLDL